MLNKKRLGIITISIIIFLVVFSLYVFLYVPIYTGLIKPPSHTLIFSHRGFGNYAPDNSFVGAQMAMEQALEGVDMDAQQTLDKEIVIFHDLSVDRLTSGTGRVTSKTLKEMESLDVGIKYGKGFEGTLVNTFEKFVNNISPKGILMVELKVTGVQNTGIEERAVEVIKKYNAYDNVYLSSFNPLVLYRLKKIDPKIHTVFIFMDTNWNSQLRAEIKSGDLVDLPWYLRNKYTRQAIIKFIRPDALSINNQVNEGVIDMFIKKGYPVFLWTVEDDERIRWALNKHPYGIISDEPLLAKKIRNEGK